MEKTADATNTPGPPGPRRPPRASGCPPVKQAKGQQPQPQRGAHKQQAATTTSCPHPDPQASAPAASTSSQQPAHISSIITHI
eukprot:scaffold4908_cov109-Isochrysis_galbana.AAC.9